MHDRQFNGLPELAKYLRVEMGKPNTKFILLYAYNGTGKTRLSHAFKDLGKQGDDRDTLYFNAFTEDLFYWDNDLKNDRERVLKFNSNSRFFKGLAELEMDNRIGPMLERYADFYFKIDTEEWEVSFSRDVTTVDGGQVRSEKIEDIKVSRSEENIFIWCFFLAILQLVLDEAEAYKWVKYVYIDDPISSLDEANAIAVANHLAQMLTKSDDGPRTVISTHHGLFFNVLCNELTKASKYFLKHGPTLDRYVLEGFSEKPHLHHLATLAELHKAQRSGEVKRHHFNMMRCIMEQTAIFFGLKNWKECIKADDRDPEKALCERMINVMSHGDYLILEPDDLVNRYKDDFKAIFLRFAATHPFSEALFSDETP